MCVKSDEYNKHETLESDEKRKESPNSPNKCAFHRNIWGRN